MWTEATDIGGDRNFKSGCASSNTTGLNRIVLNVQPPKRSEDDDGRRYTRQISINLRKSRSSGGKSSKDEMKHKFEARAGTSILQRNMHDGC